MTSYKPNRKSRQAVTSTTKHHIAASYIYLLVFDRKLYDTKAAENHTWDVQYFTPHMYVHYSSTFYNKNRFIKESSGLDN